MGIFSRLTGAFTEPSIVYSLNSGIGVDKFKNIRYKANWTDIELDTGVKGHIACSKGLIVVKFDDLSKISVSLDLNSFHKIKTFNGGDGWVWHGAINGYPSHVSFTNMGIGGFQLRFDLSLVPGDPNEIVFLL